MRVFSGRLPSEDASVHVAGERQKISANNFTQGLVIKAIIAKKSCQNTTRNFPGGKNKILTGSADRPTNGIYTRQSQLLFYLKFFCQNEMLKAVLSDHTCKPKGQGTSWPHPEGLRGEARTKVSARRPSCSNHKSEVGN